MNSSKKDTRVYSELYDILKFCDNDLKNKISRKFLKFLNDNRDKTYITNINPYLPLEEQNILEETKNYLGLVYRSYFADENEKLEFAKKDKEEYEKLEEEKRQKYNPDNIFKNKEKVIENNIEKSEVDTKIELPMMAIKKNIIVRIIDKIKKFFSKR